MGFYKVFNFFLCSLLVALAISPLATGKPKTSQSSNEIPRYPIPTSEIPQRRDFPLNQKVNPCENFHQYVCSQVESSFKLREDRRAHTFAFNDSFERLLEKKKSFMKEISQKNPSPNRVNQLKNPRVGQIQINYAACMSASARKKEENLILQEARRKIRETKTFADLLKFEEDLRLRGYDSLIQMSIAANQQNPDIHDRVLAANFLRLQDHDYYKNEELLKADREVLKELFVILFPELSEKAALTRAQGIQDFEKKFIETYPTRAERRQRWAQDRYISSADFEQKYSALGPRRFTSDLGERKVLRLPIPESFDFLQSQFQEEKNLAILKDVLLVKWILPLIDESYPTFFQRRFKFNNKFFGGPEKRPVRDERCTLELMDTFSKEIDWALIDEVFPDFPRAKMIDVAEKIRTALLKTLEENTWLSSASKKGAINKMKTAQLQLVRPEREEDWDFLPQVEYSKQTPLKNRETLARAIYERDLKRLHEPVNHKRWYMGPLTVNAYYSASANQFVMPIGILQYPFFDKDMSTVEVLGAVGAVVGHELGHGIDDQGSKYDEKGRLKEWMTEKDRFEFSRRGLAFIEQFDKAGHRGKLTLGENIGDLVGLSTAYRAAFPRGEGNLEEKQKLFISYARIWCGVRRPQFEELMLKTGPHAMGYARINEQVKHQPGFQEAFKCEAGAPMTLPESQRIKIW